MQVRFPPEWIRMDFPERLAALRKARSLTQQALADKVGVHLTQIQRYENGSVQPTLDVIRSLAIALSVSADVLIFDADERGPDGGMKLRFEALSAMSPKEQEIANAVLDAMIVKHQVTGALERVNASPPAAKGKAKARAGERARA